MSTAHFLIWQQGEGTKWYVQRTPNIRFTDQKAQALKMSQLEALETIDVLMHMQKQSFRRCTDDIHLTCVKQEDLQQ